MTARPRRDSWGKRWNWRDRFKWAWHNLVPLAAVGLAFWAVLGTEQALDDTKRAASETAREGVERRHQICLSAEREHLNDVIGLQRTYNYLAALTPAERAQTLNRFLIRGLPEAEDRVRVDPAPAFCDEPGVEKERLWRQKKPGGAPPVGLPEPDPVIPRRPAELSD